MTKHNQLLTNGELINSSITGNERRFRINLPNYLQTTSKNLYRVLEPKCPADVLLKTFTERDRVYDFLLD